MYMYVITVLIWLISSFNYLYIVSKDPMVEFSESESGGINHPTVVEVREYILQTIIGILY